MRKRHKKRRVNHAYLSYSQQFALSQIASLKSTELRKNDIITTIIGATEDVIARTALVLDEHLPANINQNIVQIRVDESIALPEYVNSYLNSTYGRNYLRYLSRQTEQVNLNCQEISSVVIPNVSMAFQNNIKACVTKAYQLQQNAKREFENAEFLLKRIIDFDDAYLPTITCKSLAESFKISGRLDAEYYQPKYDALFSTLSKHKTIPLGGSRGLVSIKKSIEPGSEVYLEEGIPFIRVSDVDKYEISTPPIMLSKDVIPNIEDLYPKKDTILLSKDGSIGIAYKLEKDMEAVTSGALLHLTVKDSNVVLPDYLTLVLNSPIAQLQAERDCNGAIIKHWKPSDIEKVLIPILDMSVQQEIASTIQESFRLRAESKRLLDLAVKTVEMAIESDEESALEWLRSKVEL